MDHCPPRQSHENGCKLSEKYLCEQIAQEERLVRIYQAELALLKQKQKQKHLSEQTSRKRSRPVLTTAASISEKSNSDTDPQQAMSDTMDGDLLLLSQNSAEHNGGDMEWLETLDALQSNDCNDTRKEGGKSVELKTRWHDDPVIYRLLPLLGGVAFTSVVSKAPKQQQSNNGTTIHLQKETYPQQQRIYELKGKVTASQTTPVDFQVLLTIEFTTPNTTTRRSNDKRKQADCARVVALEMKLARSKSIDRGLIPSIREEDGNDDELDQLAKVASETCSLPHAFRQLVCWAVFDTQRSDQLQGWQKTYGTSSLKRITPYEFDIQIHHNDQQQNQQQQREDPRNKPNRHETAIAGAITHASTTCKSDNKSIHLLQATIDPKLATTPPPQQQPRVSLRVSWKWNCSWYGKGEEVLKIIDFRVSKVNACTLPSPKFEQWMKEIRDPNGLENLLLCTGGCEGAIRVILHTMLRGTTRNPNNST